MNIKLIVGLGNFKYKYFNTRHNLGFKYIYLLANKYHIDLVKNSFLHGYVGELKLNKTVTQLFIPNSYMNTSGFSIHKCVQFYKLSPKEILIIHDDFNLPPGVIRIRLGTNIHSTHNGIKNIINNINAFDFYRLRIGIGRPNNKNEIVNFVLSEPINYEKKMIDDIIEKSIQYIEDIINSDFIKVMNILHAVRIKRM